ncbi:forkhead box protein M1 [Protopterus annectens]|uniref:forkhead box protein M1 n=1 Tax=Protopterus annectens TaxID=7888 RepID=UPI001CFB6774|nr:forkhead box protein M1 [Protopterus annectens]XP_043943537.1 forkhead box protein M1 [Protopterus annectens]
MRSSPRRPLILKRRKLCLNPQAPSVATHSQEQDVPDGALKEATCNKDHGIAHCTNERDQSCQKFPDGIKIFDHPNLPNTQVVVIPKNADIQSIITALTAKGKESGTNGPNKFILLSSGGTSVLPSQHGLQMHFSPKLNPEDKLSPTAKSSNEPDVLSDRTTVGECFTLLNNVKEEDPADEAPIASRLRTISPPKEGKNVLRNRGSSPLDDSLTNIQWLGGMSSDSLGPCSIDEEKENKSSDLQGNDQVYEKPFATLTSSPGTASVFQRPPYSYMAMIQFAINSTKSKKMTLKEIYTWIEDHFPYFKYTAKPGWKNSIRHNLSLHDMFIRETSHGGKVSYWTIHPDANRCLTLDQVFKSEVEPTTASPLEKRQQKQSIPEPQKCTISTAASSNTLSGTARRMKVLLPRIDSYLVPVHFPGSSSFVLQPSSSQVVLPPVAGNPSISELDKSQKRIRIAPKVTLSSETSGFLLPSSMPVKKHPNMQTTPCATPILKQKGGKYENSSSRRKQKHVVPPTEEPLLLYPGCNSLDSGLVADFSSSDTHELEHCADISSSVVEYIKSPVKLESIETAFQELPTSSTPTKMTPSLPLGVRSEPWTITPLKKQECMLDLSPVQTHCEFTLSPTRETESYLNFSTPFKDGALFDSPQELLKSISPSICIGRLASNCQTLRTHCREGQERLQANHSLAEGLVLDTMNDSLSKILLDVSFSGLEEDCENFSWSHFIPEFR